MFQIMIFIQEAKSFPTYIALISAASRAIFAVLQQEKGKEYRGMCVEDLGAKVKVTHMISAILLIKTQFHGPTNEDGKLARKKGQN